MNDVTNYECPVCGVIVSSGHVCAMSAIQARIDTLTAERDAAQERSKYWKAEHDRQEIADLTERLLATREQREDWAKFALDMKRERDAARAERDRLAAIVERVRGIKARTPSETSSVMPHWSDLIHRTDILAALGDR